MSTSAGNETARPSVATKTPSLSEGERRAAKVLPMLRAAISSSQPVHQPRAVTEITTLGTTLAEYVKNEAAEPEHFETFIASAQRILARDPPTKTTPAQTSRWLDDTADTILSSIQAAEAAAGARPGREFLAASTELRITAQLARFHARRCIAAVHYCLFTRGLKLAELLAATMQEKQAVAAWRELVAAASLRPAIDAQQAATHRAQLDTWRAELQKLESALRELEEQCCPPDEAILREPVWNPASEQQK